MGPDVPIDAVGGDTSTGEAVTAEREVVAGLGTNSGGGGIRESDKSPIDVKDVSGLAADRSNGRMGTSGRRPGSEGRALYSLRYGSESVELERGIAMRSSAGGRGKSCGGSGASEFFAADRRSARLRERRKKRMGVDGSSTDPSSMDDLGVGCVESLPLASGVLVLPVNLRSDKRDTLRDRCIRGFDVGVPSESSRAVETGDATRKGDRGRSLGKCVVDEGGLATGVPPRSDGELSVRIMP